MSLGSKLFDEHTTCQPQLPELTNRILVVEDDPSVQICIYQSYLENISAKR